MYPFVCGFYILVIRSVYSVLYENEPNVVGNISIVIPLCVQVYSFAAVNKPKIHVVV